MKRYLYWSISGIALVLFIIWTILVKTIDVQYISSINSYLGFYTINTQINDWVVTLNNRLFDILSLVTLIVSLLVLGAFAVVGLYEWIKRKSLKKVDPILYILLGLYAVIAIMYFVFELYKVNYAPTSTLEDMKASYPSSHLFVTLSLFISGAIAFTYYINLKKLMKILLYVLVAILCVISTLFRLMSGAHYLTDVIGAIFLTLFLMTLFVATIKEFEKKGLLFKNK